VSGSKGGGVGGGEALSSVHFLSRLNKETKEKKGPSALAHQKKKRRRERGRQKNRNDRAGKRESRTHQIKKRPVQKPESEGGGQGLRRSVKIQERMQEKGRKPTSKRWRKYVTANKGNPKTKEGRKRERDAEKQSSKKERTPSSI